MKRIAEYVGTEYRNGGDIRSTIEQNVRFAIPMPLSPSGTKDEVDKMILTKKVDAYVKRDSILDENIQKAYSLMLGQCTELLKSKLKTTTDWMTVSTDFDLLEDDGSDCLHQTKEIEFRRNCCPVGSRLELAFK